MFADETEEFLRLLAESPLVDEDDTEAELEDEDDEDEADDEDEDDAE